jgi:hypothetical protein
MTVKQARKQKLTFTATSTPEDLKKLPNKQQANNLSSDILTLADLAVEKLVTDFTEKYQPGIDLWKAAQDHEAKYRALHATYKAHGGEGIDITNEKKPFGAEIEKQLGAGEYLLGAEVQKAPGAERVPIPPIKTPTKTERWTHKAKKSVGSMFGFNVKSISEGTDVFNSKDRSALRKIYHRYSKTQTEVGAPIPDHRVIRDHGKGSWLVVVHVTEVERAATILTAAHIQNRKDKYIVGYTVPGYKTGSLEKTFETTLPTSKEPGNTIDSTITDGKPGTAIEITTKTNDYLPGTAISLPINIPKTQITDPILNHYYQTTGSGDLKVNVLNRIIQAESNAGHVHQPNQSGPILTWIKNQMAKAPTGTADNSPDFILFSNQTTPPPDMPPALTEAIWRELVQLQYPEREEAHTSKNNAPKDSANDEEERIKDSRSLSTSVIDEVRLKQLASELYKNHIGSDVPKSFSFKNLNAVWLEREGMAHRLDVAENPNQGYAVLSAGTMTDGDNARKVLIVIPVCKEDLVKKGIQPNGKFRIGPSLSIGEPVSNETNKEKNRGTKNDRTLGRNS